MKLSTRIAIQALNEMYLFNTFRFFTAEVKLNVYDKPCEISDLFIEAVTQNSVTLKWSPPAKDSGCQITHYPVQYKEVGSEKWMEFSPAVRPRIKVQRL